MKINLEGDEILEKFVEEMMLDKGVEIDEEEKERLIGELNKVIDAAIVGALPDERLFALDEALKEGELSDEKVEEIVYGSGVKFEEIVAERMKQFRDEYLGRGE